MKSIVTRGLGRLNRELAYLKGESRYLLPLPKPKKVLFDHLPKCGGSSLNLYLQAHYSRRKTFIISGLDPAASVKAFQSLSQSRRYEYDLVRGHLGREFLNYVHPECVVVTMMREPTNRIISHYYYAKRRKTHYLHSEIHKLNMTLEQYATSDLSAELRNWYVAHFSGLVPSDIEANPNDSLAKAVEVLTARYDIIGFLDEFETFIESLRCVAGLRENYNGIKSNVTTDRPPIQDIPQATIETIKDVNHLDIKLYQRIKSLQGIETK